MADKPKESKHPVIKKKCCGKTMHVATETVKGNTKTTVHKCYRCGQRDTISKEL